MPFRQIRSALTRLTQGLTWRSVGCILLGAAIATFGIHSIHQRTGITEGGVIGLMLLLQHWLGVSPSVLTSVLDASCYLLAFRYLGWQFIRTSVLSTLCVSGFYQVWEHLPYLLPDLSAYPLAAALLGALFVGVGVGLIVRQGGSSGGDDALALVISKVFGWRLSRAYMFTDFVVLGLSLTYLPVTRILFSLITVTVSSWLIDRVQGWKPRRPARRTT
ncbi:YitT family protein [uncultured Gemmiger sp.]|uniref:YitT family protein n=1 Tax=uncultured Gemmiger sp. TaxID=1623490 RepID=UPI0025D7863C|nr:YitT family protein [uncultured Gemmiger sp.]